MTSINVPLKQLPMVRVPNPALESEDGEDFTVFIPYLKFDPIIGVYFGELLTEDGVEWSTLLSEQYYDELVRSVSKRIARD